MKHLKIPLMTLVLLGLFTCSNSDDDNGGDPCQGDNQFDLTPMLSARTFSDTTEIDIIVEDILNAGQDCILQSDCANFESLNNVPRFTVGLSGIDPNGNSLGNIDITLPDGITKDCNTRQTRIVIEDQIFEVFDQGRYTFIVFVDNRGEIMESDEDNNRDTLIVDIN